jgi:alkyl sulfatase BDS1-like metallo-beta-lactamase superfamily hydrolase
MDSCVLYRPHYKENQSLACRSCLAEKVPIIGPDYARNTLSFKTAEKLCVPRPDELVQHVKLPPHLVDNPYLQEYYSSVAWSVRAIYADSVGWFDGNATKMFPLPEKDRAARIIGLSGGAVQVVSRARDALAAGDFQWAAELADYVLAVDSENVDAKKIKAQALTELGERQINATARNYYLSSAQYLLRDLPPQ